MPLFAITCTDKPDSVKVRLANREAHLAYAHQFEDRIVIGGPLLAGDGRTPVGSMLVIDLPDQAAVDDWLAADPYTQAGLFASVSVHRYRMVLPHIATPAATPLPEAVKA